MDSLVTITGVGATRLAQCINANEVAVTRFFVPAKYYNFDTCIVRVKLSSVWVEKKFPAGYYPTIQSVIDMLEYVVSSDDKVIEFAHDKNTMIAMIRIHNDRHTIILPPLLSDTLKMPTHIRKLVLSRGPVTIPKPIMLLQADFVQQQPFNDTSKPLLYVAHEPSSREFIKIPQYVPVNKTFIDTLTLSVTDENNKSIQFLDGSVLVQLHFRHKYK